MAFISNPALEFIHRYRQLSQQSGFCLLYDTLALLQELIPCIDISLIIARTRNADINGIDVVPLWVESTRLASNIGLFFLKFGHIGFAQWATNTTLAQMVNGEALPAYSFSDYPQYRRGFIDYFYQREGCSDVMAIGGLLADYQLLSEPESKAMYVAACSLVRSDGQMFNAEEKHLLALCFPVFLNDFKEKIATPGHSRYQPQITAEIFCSKSMLQRVFEIGNKFSVRELVTIKACFDFQQQQRKIIGADIARYLYLGDGGGTSTAAEKKALDKINYDLNKIRSQLFRDYQNHPDDKSLKANFGIKDITETLKIYAYCGLYPDPQQRYTSYLQSRLRKWQDNP